MSEKTVAAGTKSRGERLLGRMLRTPGVLDRKGTRWILQTLSPATVIVLVHRGRRSGKLYRTPVEILADYPDRGEFVIAPLSGRNSDWYRNVVGGSLEEVHLRGEDLKVDWRELNEEERRAAIEDYREAHPIYSRMILGMVARVNELEDDEQMLRELPMLAIRQLEA